MQETIQPTETLALIVIPAQSGDPRFSRFRLPAMDVRVRGHDNLGAWAARTGPDKPGHDDKRHLFERRPEGDGARLA